MFRRLLPKNYGFYELFERQVGLGVEVVKEMKALLKDIPNNIARIQRIEDLEHESDSVVHMTIDLLRKTFITPLDRDEIRELIGFMDDVVDFVDAAARRLSLFEISEVPKEIQQLSDVLVKAQEKVATMIKMLRDMKKHKDWQNLFREVNSLENEGDSLYRTGLAALFHDKCDPILLIKYKDIYEIMENAVDSCEDVANVIEGIIIEHVG